MAAAVIAFRRRGQTGACPCCGRQQPLTFHHLIPRKLHRRPHFRRHYDRATLAAGIMICRACHDGIHRLYDEMHLGKHLNTPDLLLADPALKRHFGWVARQRRR
ncbi:MAG: hypothetical protein AAFX44_07315 [Pseudomonadota bacterium]